MQDKKVKISLVMATYNGEKYIVEQLASIKNQTRPADEVIIVDDCSTDSTVEIIEKYIVENNLSSTWHLTINSVNKGWQKNFIDLINMATGDVIFISDQDDICYPNKFKKMMDIILDMPNALLLACTPKIHFERKRDFFEKLRYGQEDRHYGTHVIERVKFDRTWPNNYRPGCCFCFKKEIVPTVTDLWFEACPHDTLILATAQVIGQVYILNEQLHYFRRHIGNNSPCKAKTSKIRIASLNLNVTICDVFLQHKNELKLNTDLVQKIKRNRDFYTLRIKAISNRNIFLFLFLLTKTRFYRNHLVGWIADVISTFR